MSKIYKINYHSFVDIITNSSTEIYTTATNKTVEKVKQLINCFLESTNSNLSWEDLFSEIMLITKDVRYIKYIFEDLIYDGKIPNLSLDDLNNMDNNEIVKLYLKYKDEFDLDVIDDENGPFNIYLIPLDDTKTELAEHFNTLINFFQAEEFYS